MGLILKDLTPNELNEIINKFPELKKHTEPEPQNIATSEDRESGLISLLIPCIPPLLLLIKEVIAYKREIAKSKNSTAKQTILIVADKNDDPEIVKKLTNLVKGEVQ